MQENIIQNQDKWVADIHRMLDAIDKPKKIISKELRHNSERADQMMLDDPKHREHVVCDMGGQNYQIYLRATADKWERSFKYSTEDGFVDV